ncbi:MAG TPA: GumC family protein, partial [Desulfatiglandales bacterium]|nr:GumC family protein [Desulfatiglandales bacterium]
METIQPEQSLHLSEYYYILRKHRWMVIAAFIIIVTLTMIFTFLTKPVYRAAATMAIEKERGSSPLTGDTIDYEGYLNQSITLNTHLKLINSRPIMKKVAVDLNLDKEIDLEVSPWRDLISQFKKNIKFLFGVEEEPLSAEEKLEAIARTLGSKTDVELMRDTILLNISVEDHDPVLARDIANAVANAYIEFNISNRLKYSQNTLTKMTDQLYEIKKRLEDSESEFLEYKREEKIFSIEGKQKVIDQKIEDFNSVYLEARNSRLALDAKLYELKRTLDTKGDIMQVRSLINNTLIENLYKKLLDLEVELSKLNKIYKEKHPKIVQTQTQIDNTETKLQEEIDKEIKSMESERSVLLEKESVLQSTLSDFENDALDTNKKELKYTILQRNVETNRNLYDTILARVKEADITGNVDVSNIRITAEAVMPDSPVKPRKTLNFVLSVIFGLITGAGLAFLWEYLDRSLHTEEDIERYLGLPVLSVIPVADIKKIKTA